MTAHWGLEGRLQRIFERLEGYYPESVSPDLVRISALLRNLGNPEGRLPPVIHVAGTNGKGSTCAFMRAMCEAAGLRVHVYTSPHLVRFNERIRLAGALISDDYLMACLERAETALAGGEITFFEATTAAAILAFSEVEADVLILEVGLGGRLDATNIIPDSVVSVITPIAKDHEAFLGDTIAEIAREKAGIIRQNGCVVTYQDNPAVVPYLKQASDKKAAAFIELSHADTHIIPKSLPLHGAHQICNAALAAKALRLWQPDVFTNAVITQGAKAVVWPARLQRLEKTDALAHLDAEVWLDGGHNPHAAKAILTTMQGMPQPLTIICAMIDGKDAEGFLAVLGPLNAKIIMIPNFGGRPFYDPDALVDVAGGLGMTAQASADLSAALVHPWARAASTVLICGSLYLAGEVLRRVTADI